MGDDPMLRRGDPGDPPVKWLLLLPLSGRSGYNSTLEAARSSVVEIRTHGVVNLTLAGSASSSVEFSPLRRPSSAEIVARA
jgi:hypothetical protein